LFLKSVSEFRRNAYFVVSDIQVHILCSGNIKMLAGSNKLIFGPRPHVTTLHHHQHHDYTSVRPSDQQQQQQPRRRIAVSTLLHSKCVDRAFRFDTKAHHIHLYTGYSSRNEKKSSTRQVIIQTTPTSECCCCSKSFIQ
jgi:hypothetical protein